MPQMIKHKRSITPNGEPTTLELGEVAFNIVDDPVKGWIGTPVGVKRLFAGEAVEDAEDDAVYGRCNGDWVQVPIVSPTAPADPAPNSLWLDSTNARLYLRWKNAWVEITGPEGRPGPPGPKGDRGPQGDVEEAPTNGISYLRQDGVWIPMTHARNWLTANVALTVANIWYTGPQVNVGTAGTWLVTSNVGVSGAASRYDYRLTDGVTPFVSCGSNVAQAGNLNFALSGIITNPAGAIQLQTRCAAVGATMVADTGSGDNRSTMINAVRIG